MTTSIKNNKKVSIIRSAAMMLTVALAIGGSAFTTAKRADTTWHISSINGSGNYVVTTGGDCLSGNNPCSFTTDLAPDQSDGSYSPTYLSDNGVTVDKGSFSN